MVIAAVAVNKERTMKSLIGLGLIVGMVLGIAAGRLEAADPAGKAAPKGGKSATMFAPAPQPVAEPEAPAVSVAVEGQIVMRQEELGTVYIRVKDADDRVWVMAVDGAKTEIANDRGKVDASSLLEGVRVLATFPRTDKMPVASKVLIQP
jgi:hypothetical protein